MLHLVCWNEIQHAAVLNYNSPRASYSWRNYNLVWVKWSLCVGSQEMGLWDGNVERCFPFWLCKFIHSHMHFCSLYPSMLQIPKLFYCVLLVSVDNGLMGYKNWMLGARAVGQGKHVVGHVAGFPTYVVQNIVILTLTWSRYCLPLTIPEVSATVIIPVLLFIEKYWLPSPLME